MEIIPAIIGQSFMEVESKIKQLDGLVNWVHLDLMDGHFAPHANLAMFEDISFLDGKIKVEAHLMVEDPETILNEWVKVADRVLVHGETVKDLPALIEWAERNKVSLGLVLNLETPLSTLESFLSQVGLVQLMAIDEIGAQGHPLNEEVFAKIELLHTHHPNVKIQVDGGVNLNNAQRLLDAGVDNLVVGSAIWHTPDPISTLSLFQKLKAGS